MIQVQILNHLWSVMIVDSRHPALIIGDKPCNGTCWADKFEIYLDASLSKAKLPITFRHEVAHAILHMINIQEPDTYTEEALCQFVAFYSQHIEQVTESFLKQLEEAS